MKSETQSRNSNNDSKRERAKGEGRTLSINAGYIDDLIRTYGEVCPKRQKERILWKSQVNSLYRLYNTLVGFRAYKPIK